MATFNQVKYGSQGSNVTELQKLLNAKGNYNLTEDGIFGAKTQAAVEDYQQNNGLTVDGIVGNNTWGSLTGGSQASGTATTGNNSNKWSYDPFEVSDQTAAADQNRQQLASQKPGDFTYGAYEKSDTVKQAEALLQQQLANKPGAYQSAWQTQLDDTLNKILNREKFSYDLNGDALYQQYKNQYMTQGQQAMMDTMGQAQAMTGGYGNSYAQTVGQQTYQGYMQQLNDKVPELYQLALSQYNREGDELYNQYGLYADRDSQDYGRYRDTVSDFNTELARLTEDARYQGEQDYGKFMDAYNIAYGQYRDAVGDWQTELGRLDEDYWNQYSRDFGEYTDDRDYKYKVGRDAVEDEKWEKEFGLQEDQWNTEKNKVTNAISEAVRENGNLLSPIQGTLAGNLTPEETQPTETKATKAFEAKLSPESNHDAIARATYGPYSSYVAYMLENANLSQAEEDYLISKYGITSSDRQYLIDKGLIK
jgi:peptidoglycan hydrolase-like protein with peptidoglycan-binding domain